MTTRENTEDRNKKTESKAVNTDKIANRIPNRSVKTAEPPKQESNIFAEPQAELTAKADQDLSYLFYDSPYVADDGVFRPLLLYNEEYTDQKRCGHRASESSAIDFFSDQFSKA